MRTVLLSLAIALCLSPLGPSIAAGAAAADVKTAPGFALKDLTGNRVTLDEFRGKVVVLGFWATWCVPCREEMPSLQRLYEEFKDAGLTVLAVSIDPSASVVRSFAAEKGLTFPVLLDPDKEVYFDDYAVHVLPTSFLIDRNGNIAKQLLGEVAWDSEDARSSVIRLLKTK